VGQLPGAMPKTIGAADHVRRHAHVPDARRKAGDLLQALVTVECIVTMGGQAEVLAGLLRDVVIITAQLAGRTWLETNSETPAAAAFAAVTVTQQPPLLPELDQILASLLSSRFPMPAPAAAQDTGAATR
jgi:hypothetical protein